MRTGVLTFPLDIGPNPLINKRLTTAVLLFSLALNACMFVPERKPQSAQDAECDMIMPKWKLSVAAADDVDACNGSSKGEAEACLVTLGIIIPVGSFVVSGSIVITGNTLRWLEYQGKCDDSTINRALALLKKRSANDDHDD